MLHWNELFRVMTACINQDIAMVNPDSPKLIIVHSQSDPTRWFVNRGPYVIYGPALSADVLTWLAGIQAGLKLSNKAITVW